ncbi:MAG TPA: hypothetical protein VLD36_17360 [Burkholderiales bacterium]|nr:hypothetical protein [Burkholderiales bacterium]
MWNGNAVAAGVLSFAASIVSIGGCDIGAASRLATTEHHGQQAQLPNGRYRIDPERHRAWFLTHEGVYVYDISRPERVAVPLPGWVSVDTRYGCLPDLALGPKGEAVITSNSLPTLWRIDPDTLAVSVHPLLLDADTEKDVGFSGLAYSAQHGAFLAASYSHGSLWRIDPLYKTAQKILLSAPIPGACGLAMRPRSAQQAFSRFADLCVHTPRGGWTVVFASDLRSAYVSTAPCTDRPWPLDAVWPKEE